MPVIIIFIIAIDGSLCYYCYFYLDLCLCLCLHLHSVWICIEIVFDVNETKMGI